MILDRRTRFNGEAIEMSLSIWILVFAVSSLFWGWIVFLGGADWLEGSILSAFLVSVHAPQWSAEELKAFVGIIWFLVGLFVPGARL